MKPMNALTRLLYLVPLIAALGACAEPEPESTVKATSRPVKTVVVETPEGAMIRTFPGRIEAANRADVSFRVGGKLAEILVREGDNVDQGQLLASLDSRDYEIALSDAQAIYDAAAKNYERGKQLVNQGTISRVNFDELEARFKSADAALRRANQDIEYTKLTAPFAGTVARRLVENFEEVAASEPVLALTDVDELEVKVNVPENIMLPIRRADPNATDQERDARVRVEASFDSAPDLAFPLKLKEVSTRADANTQTFEVTFLMPAPKELNVLPGMTVTVTADLSAYFEQEQRFFLPARAVVANSGMEPRVWVVDEVTMTVSPRPISVGSMRRDEIEVLDGLEPGERVVVAGVSHLVEGMQVTLMPDLEQAEPRADDPASS
jgi:RND family efflux transporter MFP subunit